ncbi:MAG TPA: hypothetical protein VM290_02840 [Gaiellaceae bacterium]|nr:hypothetical protein [Gaiellaceae bacterium]
MAARLLAEWDRETPLLVVAGAFHARADVPGTMAAHLRRELDRLEPAMLRYERGRCWSRGREHDVAGPMPSAPIELRLPEATPAVAPGRSR